MVKSLGKEILKVLCCTLWLYELIGNHLRIKAVFAGQTHTFILSTFNKY